MYEDKLAKSISFFCLNRPIHINSATIGEMKIISKQGQKSVHICLHRGPNLNKYYRPHKHRDKSETYHLIKDKLAIFIV